MANFERRGDPEHLATLVEIGLESQQQDDRLLALEAANHFDYEHKTSYGKEVLELFMGQAGLRFIDPPEAEKGLMYHGTSKYRISTSETPELGKVIATVYQAIQQDVEMSIEMVEYVSEGGGMFGPLVTDVKEPAGPRPFLNTRIGDGAMDISPERPFGFRREHWGSTSLPNFYAAVDAVVGERGFMEQNIASRPSYAELVERWRDRGRSS